MEMVKFLAAIESQNSCANCVFFEKNESWSSDGTWSNAVSARSTTGRCMRFPPVLVRLATDDEDAVFEQPSIKVTVTELRPFDFTENADDVAVAEENFFRIDDHLERLPLCGEHKPTSLLDYADCDSW